jgi:surface polysaccharide O-acyltransferase-like enzyme
MFRSLPRDHSLRLKLLNFPLIVGVVYIHAYNAEITFGSTLLGPAELDGVSDFIRKLISQGIARLAVPLFFLVSGYFFFLDYNGHTMVDKLRTRCRTLLLPYIFWTVGFAAIRLIGQHLPGLAPYCGAVVLSDLAPAALLDAVFGFTRAPEAYHFWFIRDLMLLMLVGPLLHRVLRLFARPYLLMLFVVWIFGKWPLYPPEVVGLLFFSFGGYCALRGHSLFALDAYGQWFVALFLPLLIVDVLWYDAWFNVTLHRCTIVVGLVAVFYLSRFLRQDCRYENALLRLGGASFFVYAAHEPLLGIVRTVAFQTLPLDLPAVMLLIYLLLPLLVVAVLVLLHQALVRLVPRGLRVVTGGR